MRFLRGLQQMANPLSQVITKSYKDAKETRREALTKRTDSLQGFDPLSMAKDWATEKAKKEVRDKLSPIMDPIDSFLGLGSNDFDEKPSKSSLEHWMANYIIENGTPLSGNRFFLSVPININAILRSIESVIGSQWVKATIKDGDDSYGEAGGPTLTFLGNHVNKIAMYACRSVTMPGNTIATFQTATINGPRLDDYPYQSTFPDVTATFIGTQNHFHEKRVFDGWMNHIINKDTQKISYKSGPTGYATTIKIVIYNTYNDEVSGIELRNAYPKAISDVTLSHDDENIVNFQVTFAYDDWRYTNISSN